MNLARFTRWQAAAIHLGISAAIALAVVGAMRLVWYPAPYFDVAGGATLLLLLVGVDVVVGPLLTLVVYSPRKKHLRADLAVIAALQLAALAYGVSVMYAARPVYVAFAGDRFELVAANATADIERWVAGSGKPEAAWGYLPLRAQHGDMAMIVDAATGAVAGVLAIDPW